MPYNMSLRDISIKSDNPRILYELRPNSEIIFTGQYAKLSPTTIKISSNGIRDYQYMPEKPQGVYRIVILGDSVAFGWGVELEHTFAKYLERFLQERRIGRFEVINFGVPGYNLAQEIATLEYKCLDYHPDLIIFCIEENDYKPLFNYYCPITLLRHLPQFIYKSYLINWILERVVYYMDKVNSREFNRGIVEVDRAIDNLCNILLKHNIKVLFYPDVWWLHGILKKYNLDNLIINSDGIIFKDPHYTYERDGHPNKNGHRKIAEEIYNYLEINGYLKSHKEKLD